MRRRLLTYTLSAALAGLILWACQRDRFGHDDPNAVEPTLTVGEARDFFEYQFSEMLPYMTKAEGDMPVGMMPGDFTPLWDKATRAADRWTESVDLPIDPHFIFTAEFRKIDTQGDTVFKTVNIVQKLVVTRWHDHPIWNGMYVYVASLIPVPEYYAQHKDFGRRFVNLGKNDFSGLVIYHTIDGCFVNADKYRNGKMIKQAYDPVGTSSLESALTELEPNMTVYGGTPTMYSVSMETPEITVQACQRCGMQDCYCQSSGGGCYCQTIGHEGEREDPPPVPPGGGSTGGGGGGGSGSTGGETDNTTPRELMDISKFVGYLTSGDCMQGCIQILANYGIRTYSVSTIIMATEGTNGQLNIYPRSYIDGVNAINRHINAGRPIIAGISRGWGIGVGNYNAATDHFVVITGRGIDYNTGKYYYTYMETGTSNSTQGCNTNNNRLYLDPVIPILEDLSGMNGDKYRVTEVRINDNN
ncbi:hypothetical protein [Rikenella microfusus]|uniref:hypothetical protein n=1 Tax=Rikenella microfusus TaxID=28139 RepID=UPI00248E423C|nr:hypothetical protein [Rikenella microfusus]